MIVKVTILTMTKPVITHCSVNNIIIKCTVAEVEHCACTCSGGQVL